MESVVPVGEGGGVPQIPELRDEGVGWSARRRRRLGPLEAHARFLQYIYRRSVARRPGCWRRGGMTGLWPFLRPRPAYACDGGLNLASDREFGEVASVGREAQSWYDQYVDMLRRLRAGRVPTSLELFGGEGGKSAGVQESRGASHGVDSRPQPRYVARFGKGNFSQGDATSAVFVRRLARKVRAECVGASPPCKVHSTARMRGEASEPDLLASTRVMLQELGLPWVMENVLGARKAMRDPILLRGSMFGLHVDRPRLFESSFGLHVDEALLEGSKGLRARCCLGRRQRWRRVDAFGRPEPHECCRGNIFAVQGDKPWRCTLEECAVAMGLESGHMSYVGMSQAIPPAYGRFVFAQTCMSICVNEFGAPRWTFDDMLRDRGRARREMHAWLRGAGAAEGEAALAWGGARGVSTADATGRAEAHAAHQSEVSLAEPAYAPPKGGDNDSPDPPSEARVREAEFREVYFSWAGDFDQQLRGGRDPSMLDELVPASLVHEDDGSSWVGRRTLVHVGRERLRALLPFLKAATDEGTGAAVCVVTEDRACAVKLRAAGFVKVRETVRGAPAYASAEGPAAAWRALSVWSRGRVVDKSTTSRVDFEEAERHMDPRDLVKDPQEAAAKALRSYMPIGVDAARWAGLQMADDLAEMMQREGARIVPEVEPGFAEHPFYPVRDNVGLMKSIVEVDRALITGSMEYVPADQIARVRSEAVIHPWTMADQGGGKWRACQDYSCGTNLYVRSAPFGLPEVWDVGKVVKEDSHFAKYDIRDGFWHCPVAPDSRHRLVLRHPGNGRLVWSTRLPFGYLDSPRLFCGVTEAVAQAVRHRAAAAGVGVHVFVFVDDYLVVGDTAELTKLGCTWLEEELAARGLEWAPHKQRGPCRCIEFLGLMLCNYEGCRRVTVSRSRLEKTRAELVSWRQRRGAPGQLVEVDPVELARLLGRLVFFSQVVVGGRTYMQGMLASFRGLVVDWRRSLVSVPKSNEWRSMQVGESFFRDLDWWCDHVELRHSVEMAPPARGEACLTGTDASGWGTGQVAWIDGGREETVLKFTAAEKRRPINWRELLGVLRVVEQFGARLAGCTVLVETDNMAAKGSAAKKASKAPDMQELLRRLLRRCEMHGILLKVTHTPGEKLDRPDQTSRGDPVEEPRARIKPSVFRHLESRWGPFDMLIGPEREFATRGGSSDGRQRLWVHPTRRTVGSALRLIGERMESGGGRVNALAVVPSPPSPAWAGLLRHGTVVGELPVGPGSLEEHTHAGWRPLSSSCAHLIVSFPRAAGAFAYPLVASDVSWLGAATAGYRLSLGGEFVLPIPAFGYVYSPSKVAGTPGSLCRMSESFGSNDEGDTSLAKVRELPRLHARHAWARGAKHCAFEVPPRARVWARESGELYSVSHLVQALGQTTSGLTLYVDFDWKRAESEIEQARSHVAPEEPEWEEVGSSPFSSPSSSRGLAAGSSPDALDDAAAQLGDLNLRAASTTKGAQGALGEPQPKAPPSPFLKPRAPKVQLCMYGGMPCAGCGELLGVGTRAVSVADGLTHEAYACVKAAEKRVAETAKLPEGTAKGPPRFFVVTNGLSTGVFSELSAAKAAAGGLAHVRTAATMAEARELLGRGAGYGRAQANATLAEMPVGAAKKVVGGAAPGSIQRRTQLSEKLSIPRLALITRCIDGRCGVQGEAATACLGGCGRTLHMLTCAQVGKGYAALGNFTCPDCRLARLVIVGEPTPDVRRRATQTMVMEMTQGAESTAGGYADYVRLAEEYSSGSGMAAAGGRLVMPQDSLEACKNFVTWLVMDDDRALSLEQALRGGEAYVTKTSPTGATNVFKSPALKAHVKAFAQTTGKDRTPRTAATPKMLKIAVEESIPARWPKEGASAVKADSREYHQARWSLEVEVEGVAGARVGEAVGAGDFHGLTANNVCIIKHPECVEKWNKEVVEFKLEHSKTGHPRYLNVAGTTQVSNIKVADTLRRYWQAASFATVTEQQAGAEVTRADYWVVRVSLLGVASLDSLIAALNEAKTEEVKKHAKVSISYAKERHKATGVGSQAKKYVNIAGGAANSRAVAEAVMLMNSKGWGAFTSVTPGPLIRSTSGYLVTHMPLQTSSTFDTIKQILSASCEAANKVEADPHLDLQGRTAPVWTNHSLRRLGDTNARRFMEDTRFGRKVVKPWEIDLLFGWNEAEMEKDMQMHYATMGLWERIQQARITCMI